MYEIGPSSYITGMAGLQATIATCQRLGMNTIRIASREGWLDQYGRDNRRFHREYVDYVLANTDLTVVLDINHVYYETDGHFDVDGGSVWIQQHWQQVLNWVVTVAQLYANNDRVIIEVFNEYSLSDFWAKAQQALDFIRQYSANFVLFNKWAQPWTQLYDPYDKTVNSYHYYFNPEYWTPAGAEADVQRALNLGLRVLNTEVGAHSSGGPAITAETVAKLNAFLAWCMARGVGNCIWNTNDVQDFPRMEALGLIVPVPPPPPTFLVTVLAVAHGSVTPAPGVYEVASGSAFTVRCTPDAGYRFIRFLVNGVPVAENPVVLTVNQHLTVVPEVGPPAKGILSLHAYVNGNEIATPYEVKDTSDITGVTPATLELDVGPYRVDVTHEGETQSQTVTVLENQTTRADFTFAVPDRAFTVQSTPISGIPITINAQNHVTPVTVQAQEGTTLVVAVPSNVELNGDIYNFDRWADGPTSPTRTIVLAGDVTVTCGYVLQPPQPRAELDIHAFLDDMEVVASFEVVGTGITGAAPAIVEVDPGTYTIRCTLPEALLPPQTQTVTVLEGQTLRVDFLFTTPKPRNRFLQLAAPLAAGIGLIYAGSGRK